MQHSASNLVPTVLSIRSSKPIRTEKVSSEFAAVAKMNLCRDCNTKTLKLQ